MVRFKILILFLLLQLPIYPHIPVWTHIPITAYHIGVCIVYINLDYFKKSKILKSYYLFAGLIAIILVINFYTSRWEDSQRLLGKFGSDQDDALIQAGQRLIAGLNPFSELTYLGSKISPGIGLVILLLPFTYFGHTTFFICTPFFVLITALIAIRLSNIQIGNLFVLLLMSSPMFWSMAMASDYIIIGCLIVLSTIFTFTSKSFLSTILTAIFIAFVATSRMQYGVLIPLLGYVSWKSNGKFILLLIISFFTYLILNGTVFSINTSEFTFLHYFDTATNNNTTAKDFLSTWVVIVTIILFILPGVLLSGICRISKFPVTFSHYPAKLKTFPVLVVYSDLKSALLYIFASLLPSLLFVSIIDWHSHGFVFLNWQGAVIPSILIPICIVLYLTIMKERK